jgi:signal transduction histidine kinase
MPELRIPRRSDWWLLAIAVALSAGLFIPGLVIGSSWSNSLPNALVVVPVVFSFLVGWRVPLPWSVTGLVALTLAMTAGELSGSLLSIVVFTAPAWIGGVVLRSRADLSDQLAARADELERQREAFARESVRYERTRIARDLHDIIAHNLSMIVVQAAASRRMVDSDPSIAVESLRHIEGGAQRAEREIDQLVQLLSSDDTEHGADGLMDIDELLRRVVEIGVSVTYSFSGDPDTLPPELSELAFRLSQEGITNALKHAPGAPIQVRIDANTDHLTVAIENAPAPAPTAPAPRLRELGGGFGLTGLRDRVTALNGTLKAGPSSDAAWRLEAIVPSAAPSPATIRLPGLDRAGPPGR